jgi:hypothetical protein
VDVGADGRAADDARSELAGAEDALAKAEDDLAAAEEEIATIAGDLPDREDAVANAQAELKDAQAQLDQGPHGRRDGRLGLGAEGWDRRATCRTDLPSVALMDLPESIASMAPPIPQAFATSTSDRRAALASRFLE